MYVKKVPFVGYFLLGYSVNIIGAVIASAFFLGLVPYNNFTFYAHSVSTFFESILFSILLAYRMKTLNLLAQEKDHELKLQDSKMVAMSEVIDNIAHQWRQPLSQVNSVVMLIDHRLSVKEFKDEFIDKKLVEIEALTDYMSKTIDDFRNYLSTNKPKEKFFLSNIIKSSLLILQGALVSSHIEVETNLDSKLSHFGHKNELQQVLLAILNNAKDVLVINKVINAKITVNAYSNKSFYIISICDNGRGVNDDIKNKIFEPYFTTKHKAQGTGLGLYMSKMIIEDSLNGELSLENSNTGACFVIKLRKN